MEEADEEKEAKTIHHNREREREDCKRIVSEDCCWPAGKLLLSLQGKKRMDTDGLNRKCGSTTAEAVSTLTWNSHTHTQLTTHRDLARLEFN